jgi:hypothetical protein
MNLTLGPTFIEDFRLSKEPAFLVDNRLFTIGREVPSEDIFHFLEKDYALEESEELKKLEDNLYENKSSEIEKYIRDIIRREYNRKVSCINKEISRLLSIADNNKRFSVEKFIIRDVFFEYISRESRKYKRETKSPKPIIKKKLSAIPERSFSYPSVEDVRGKRPIIDSVVRQPVLILGERAFYLMITNKPKKIFIKYKNRFYATTKSKLTAELEYYYTNRIIGDIRKRTLDYKTGLDELLKDGYKQLNKIKEIIQKEDRFTGIRHKQVKDIGFKKLDTKTYQLYLDISPKYSVDKRKIRIATEIIADSSSITLTGPARVIEGNPSCEHVFSGGRICYDGNKRWEKREVAFRKYSTNELKEEKVAFQLACILEEAKTILTSGR